MDEFKQTSDEQDEIKLNLLRWAISSKEGWKNLAKIIKTSSDPVEARINCVLWLHKLAGDHEVDLPAIPLKAGQTGEDSADAPVEMIKVRFADLLEQQLDQHLRELDLEIE